MQTRYVVQTYSVNCRRQIVRDQPRQVESKDQAIRLAERMTDSKFGVVAFSHAGNPEADEFEDFKILFQFGDYTREDADFMNAMG